MLLKKKKLTCYQEYLSSLYLSFFQISQKKNLRNLKDYFMINDTAQMDFVHWWQIVSLNFLQQKSKKRKRVLPLLLTKLHTTMCYYSLLEQVRKRKSFQKITLLTFLFVSWNTGTLAICSWRKLKSYTGGNSLGAHVKVSCSPKPHLKQTTGRTKQHAQVPFSWWPAPKRKHLCGMCRRTPRIGMKQAKDHMHSRNHLLTQS